MEITTNVRLFGEEWFKTLEYLVNSKEKIFDTFFDVFYLCSSIGIYYDEIIDIPSNPDYVREIPRLVLINRISKLGYLYQIAVLTSKNVSFSESERMNYAFDNEKSKELGELKFLVKFANFGLTKLLSKIDFSNSMKTVDSINTYLQELVEGNDIDKILSKLKIKY